MASGGAIVANPPLFKVNFLESILETIQQDSGEWEAMRILVVDDDRGFRELLSEELSVVGHTVVEAEDGQQAWEMLSKEPARLVITDWMMPKLDGPQLINRIRNASFPHYVYIILLTAKTSQQDVVTGLVAGADDYLRKPLDLEELQARVAISERILSLEMQLREALYRLEVAATHDSLTGLLNRQAINEYAEAELSRVHRAGGSMSVAVLDIDHFKSVNDRFGHLVGDRALRHVAETIASTIRPYDKAGRWGGEEFMLVLPETNLDQAFSVAERVRERVASSPVILPSGEPLYLHVSLGVSETEAESLVPLDTLFNQADEALYVAKRGGRNQVVRLLAV